MVPCGTPVLPYLYLGGGSDASDPEKLKSLNIYYVLNVTTDLPGDGESDSIRYKRIPAIDAFEQNLVQYFEESFQFIEEARKAGRAVLIHCHAGISRSPTIVIAYLMYSQKMSLDKALLFVQSKRSKINPNFSFLGQLYEYGNLIDKLKTTLPTSLPSPTSNLSSSTPTISLTKQIPELTTSSSNSMTTTSKCLTAFNNSPLISTTSSTSISSSSLSSKTTTTITTSISAPTTPTSPKPLTPSMPTTPIVTTLPIPTIPTSRSYLKISDTLKKPFFLLPPPRPSNLSLKEGLTKSDFPSSCEALSDIPYNSLGPVRGCRSRKSCNNDFILLRPIKMTKNTRVK
ncbi:tyrosine-protein phosphatase vhp-1 [Tetranychus urticae]|uniref:protein-tyrosine-phosphatase n=1 Tax=Tetranychus urticae TaxID=32264 RepID=T1KX11_TETUR|nr:tyrosine-protein phosphatase vhp-1 [Tetranychus urticae]XP_015791307.1 tyrosine-protein phosphatase vhp-1 [Tetranychus urticae]